MELNKRECKVCLQVKDRMLAGQYLSKNKRWVDETGKSWNGRVCPSCTIVKSRDNMRKLRASKPTKLGQEVIESLTEILEGEVNEKTSKTVMG